jgi:hypothetical protein
LARFNPKSFAQPDLLRTIEPANLLRILEPCRGFLESRGLSWPQGGEASIDYESLSRILAQPDEWMPAQAIEGLHVISNLGTDANFDALLDIARRNFIDVDLDTTAADLAARIWIEVPQALVVKERETGCQTRRRFEVLRARNPEDRTRREQIPLEFSALETALEEWFVAKKRGICCRVARVDLPDEIRFFVQHGQPCKRKDTRQGAESTCAFFRPERTDLVIYDLERNELRISTSTLGELKLYREKFGQYVFDDPERFVYASKYTLAPLQTAGAASLRCRDIGGLEWIRLTGIEYAWPEGLNHIERHKADDLFRSLELQHRRIDANARLVRARFLVKLTGETTPRPVLIQPPNIAEYGRGEEAALIEEWLLRRSFAVNGASDGDEYTLPLMEVA